MSPLILFLLLLLPPPEAAPVEGELHLRGEAGLKVFVDGMDYGKTIAGGLVLTIPAGDHKVTIRSATGEENTFDVTIQPNRPTELQISSLGLRRSLRRPQNGAVRIRGANRCSATAVGVPSEQTEDGLAINPIPVGEQMVTVTCDGRSAQRRVKIRAGYLTSLNLDKRLMSLSVGGEERLSLAVEVNENNAITMAAIPASWKRALSRVVVPGVRVEGVTQMSVTKLAMRARGPNESALYNYRWKIGESVGVTAVERYRVYKYGSDYMLDMVVIMEPGD